MSTKISKAATLANLFIKLICSNGPKIEFESIRIDSHAKSRGADHVAIVRFFNWLHKAVCSVKIDQLSINFTDVGRFYLIGTEHTE